MHVVADLINIFVVLQGNSSLNSSVKNFLQVIYHGMSRNDSYYTQISIVVYSKVESEGFESEGRDKAIKLHLRMESRKIIYVFNNSRLTKS